VVVLDRGCRFYVNFWGEVLASAKVVIRTAVTKVCLSATCKQDGASNVPTTLNVKMAKAATATVRVNERGITSFPSRGGAGLVATGAM